MNVADLRDITYTQTEAAFHIGVCLDTVRRWVRSGKLRSVRLPAGPRIPRSEVERLLTQFARQVEEAEASDVH